MRISDWSSDVCSSDLRITFANGVPTMFRMIVDAPGFADRDLTSLVGMNMGGAPMPAGLLHELVAAFPNARFYNTYGMNAVTSAATVSEGLAARDLTDDERQWSTIGRKPDKRRGGKGCVS